MQAYQNVAQDLFGSAVNGVQVTVKVAGTSTVATIFSDNGITPLANPFTNSVDGSFKFYAANGRYDVVLVKAGYTFVANDLADIILYDANNAPLTGVILFGTIAARPAAGSANRLYIATDQNNIIYLDNGSSWVQSGGSPAVVATGTSTSRLFADRFAEVINVKDFGAVGDGVANDTSALASALTFASSVSKPVYLPPGTYNTDPFSVPTALPGLIGAGSSSTTIAIRVAVFGAAQRMIDARNNVKGPLIKGFALNVNNSAFDATWSMDITGSSNCLVDDLSVTGSAALGVVAQGGSNLNVQNIRMNGTNGGFGRGVWGDSTVATLTRYTVRNLDMTGINTMACQITGTAFVSSFGHAIYDSKADSSTIFGFGLVNVESSTINGCFSRNSTHEAFQLTDCIFSSIENCRGEWDNSHGLDFGCSINGTVVESRFCRISNNTFFNPYKSAVAVADWTQESLIVGNLARDAGVRLKAAGGGTGDGAFVAYTTTAGAQNIGNTFQDNMVINETGSITNFFAEIQGGGGGAATNFNLLHFNVFRGTVTGANYVIVGANSSSTNNTP